MKSIFNKLLENIIILNWWFEHNFKRKHQLQFGVTLLTLLLIVTFNNMTINFLSFTRN